MRYRINNIKLPYRMYDIDKEILKKIAKKLNISEKCINNMEIIRRSIDARKKDNILFVYMIDFDVKKPLNRQQLKEVQEVNKDKDNKYCTKKFYKRPIIVGSGPSGLFCALILARAGAEPIVIEQGSNVEERHKKIIEFIKFGKLDENTNVQFGEGGAGTFSDGKINTSVKDKRNRFVLEEFVKFGAEDKILYDYKPHIGTDVLAKILVNIRKEIEKLGGKFMFDTKFISFVKSDFIQVFTDRGEFKTEHLILGLGNSSRQTFVELKKIGMEIEPKPFAVGYRVQHSQKMINQCMYGDADISILGVADYKLTYTTEKGIPVYSFCMCPGGYVVNSSSERGQLVINGMSYSRRNSKNANSAIIMGINFNTIEEAVSFQIDIEKKAYNRGNGKIPTMLYGDFKRKVVGEKYGSVYPQFKGEAVLANIRGILPKKLEEAFIEGMEAFGKKIEGFNSDDVLVSAVESRTSSPVRMKRNKDFMSNIIGVYPIGEGAGYAGGIMSAAIDGIKVAQSILGGYDE